MCDVFKIYKCWLLQRFACVKTKFAKDFLVLILILVRLQNFKPQKYLLTHRHHISLAVLLPQILSTVQPICGTRLNILDHHSITGH